MRDNLELLIMGGASLLAGALGIWLVYMHPEGLHAPAWVVYGICCLFIVVGLAIIASCIDSPPLRRAFIAVTAFGILAAGAWAALA